MFYLTVGGVVLLNEFAATLGIQGVAFVPLMLIVFWAAYKFLPGDQFIDGRLPNLLSIFPTH